ncbi:MAG: response regulator [Halothiobacillaceae bacterium]|nr:MAG: response regulator [Halothiobacillaceae bacterium]
MDTTEAVQGAEFAGLKVMVVDDSKTIRRTAETLLAKAGCAVDSAVDGFDALGRIPVFEPDLIFIDILMPRLDGYQACALIKNNRRFRRTPVILLSSKDSIFDKARGRIVGADDYLTKPFTSDELLAALRQHARKGSGAESLTLVSSLA